VLYEQSLAHAQLSLSRVQLQLNLSRWCKVDVVPLRVRVLVGSTVLAFAALVLLPGMLPSTGRFPRHR